MADSSSKRSSPERAAVEDADTAAARKELKQTVISDSNKSIPPPLDAADSSSTANKDGGEKPNITTPELSPAQADADRLKEQASSPKKKRAHDEVDEHKDQSQAANGDVSPLPGTEDRSARSEPEKKRPRDVSSEHKALVSDATTKDAAETSELAKETKTKPTQTTASAFGNSGLSAFATTASPFGATSGAKPLSSFSSGTSSASPFKSMGSSSPSVFGGSALSKGSSPFGQARAGGKTTFGSGSISSGFGSSSIGGAKLTSFGKAGEAFKSSKPAKAFGAPESDAESGDEDAADDENEETKETREEKEVEEKEEKKVKLHRVNVDDGETGEATILSVRTKIYHLDKASKAWKERGAGNLKINVPLQCVDIDEDTGGPIPGSFDASAMEDGEAKVVRLVMRQDSTHRVILNTAVIPATVFQEKQGLKSVTILFTAIEGDNEAVSIQFKMNAINAKAFLNEIGKIQRELQSS